MSRIRPSLYSVIRCHPKARWVPRIADQFTKSMNSSLLLILLSTKLLDQAVKFQPKHFSRILCAAKLISPYFFCLDRFDLCCCSHSLILNSYFDFIAFWNRPLSKNLCLYLMVVFRLLDYCLNSFHKVSFGYRHHLPQPICHIINRRQLRHWRWFCTCVRA